MKPIVTISIILCFFLINYSCKKQDSPTIYQLPPCDAVVCEDEYFSLDTLIKDFFVTSYLTVDKHVTNGNDTMWQRQYFRRNNYTNKLFCESSCPEDYQWYSRSQEQAFVLIHAGNFLYPHYTAVYIRAGIDSIPEVVVEETHQIPSYAHDSWETESESTQMSFLYENMSDYYIGSFDIYGMHFTGIFKVTFHGVDLYYSRTFGLLNNFSTPDYFIIP